MNHASLSNVRPFCIGILGGGQLARMLSLAAYPLGIHTLCIDPKNEACAADVTKVIKAAYTDQTSLIHFAEAVDVLTYETENIPLATAQWLNRYKPVFPSTKTLAVTQDRLQEKMLFQALKIPTTCFAAVDSLEELYQAIESIGLPCVLKTRFSGYDGKGQCVIRTQNDITPAWQQLEMHTPLLVEECVFFDKEVSLLAVRGQEEVLFYALSENKHCNGILYLSTAPYQDSALQLLAEGYVKQLLDYFDYRGVLAVEFFLKNKTTLLANEIAPRVHNSGHWTIEGASTSQFENHIRAVAGLPLGSTRHQGFSAMFNCIGAEPDLNKILSIPDVHYHCYHKSPAKNRKLAHCTLSTTDWENYNTSFQAATAILKDNGAF